MSPKVRALRKGGVGLWLALLAVALAGSLAGAAPLTQPAADGQALFQEKCAGCHTIGGGRLVGPDLKGVTERRDRQWLARFIAGPDRVLAGGDPIASSLVREFNNVLMPNLGLTQDQVAALVAYLGAPGGATAPAPLTPLPPAGDPARGKALFTGDVDFGSHGPPCLGCHSIDRVGVLGGGVMGPDLTQAFASYGAEGLAAALANIPFPTMEPIYTRHPLTPEEQADLWAFLQAESGQQQANAGLLEGVILALSLGGFAVAMAMAGLLWRRRLRGVRRPLVERTAHSAPEN